MVRKEFVINLLFATVAVIIVACTLGSRAWAAHGYSLPIAWHVASTDTRLAAIDKQSCNQLQAPHGFPFTEIRPSEDGCVADNNWFAFTLNNTLYGASY